MRTSLIGVLVFSFPAFAASPSVSAKSGAAAPAPAPAAPEEPSPGFRLPAGASPLDYAITFDVDPNQETFSGTEVIKVHLDAAQKTVWLHAHGLDVTSAKIAGQVARFKQVDDDGMARVSVDTAVGPGDVDVELAWKGKLSDSLEGIYRVQSEGTWYVFTQFESISARNAFPCFDEPGFKATFTAQFNIPEGDRVVSNTGEARSSEIGNKRVNVQFTKTKPLPAYLLAFAVGPLEIVDGKTLPPNDLRKEPLKVRGVATKGHGKQLARSLDVAQKSLINLEKWFGVGYPFGKMDIVAVPDFAAGAMENAGLVTFRDQLLFVDDKSPIGLQKANVYVIAHEFAHQWFGDLVTLAWWDDVWLNEAFATWMETPIVNVLKPEYRATTEQRASLDGVTGEDSLVTARQIRQPVLSKGDILNAFDGITYQKGASVIEMFASSMGRDKFQRGVREYIKAHAYGTATAKDLLAALSKAAGKDIATPFSTFLDQPGVPLVDVKIDCSDKKAPKLTLAQSRYLPVGSTGDRSKTWQIPVCVRLNAQGTQCMTLTNATSEMALKSCPKSVHPNADGVGYYRFILPPDQLKALATTLPKLTAGERISFSNALRGGLHAATVPFADALEASLPLARDEEPSIARTPYGMLDLAWTTLVAPEARASVQKKIADTYRPVLDKVKLEPKDGEDPRVRERRTLAIGALLDAEDKATLELLAPRGRAVLDLDNPTPAERKVHLEKIPGDLAGSATLAAVRLGGAQAWDDVNALVTTETDSTTRSYLLRALSRTTDEALAQKARALALDPRLKVNEVFTPLFSQTDFRTREATWTWLQKNYDAVAARLPSEFGTGELPALFDSFCSEDKAKELEAFFGPRKDKVPGMERTLANSLESIRLCAVEKTAHEESARKMFPAP